MLPVQVPQRASGPTFEPISLNEAKRQCGFAECQSDWDDHLNSLIVVSRELVEGDTGVVLGNSTFTYKLDCWPCGRSIALPLRPVREITSIVYTDSQGTSQTWASSNYRLDTARNQPHIWLANDNTTWPSLDDIESAVTITLVAGYATVAAVPQLAKQLCLLNLAALFRNREGDAMAKVTGYEYLRRRLMRTSYP